MKAQGAWGFGRPLKFALAAGILWAVVVSVFDFFGPYSAEVGMTEIAGLRLGVALVIDKDAVFFEYTPRETSAAVGEMNRFEGGELVAIGEMSAVTAIGDLIRFLLQ